MLCKKHDFRMKIPFHLGMASFGLLAAFLLLAFYPRTVLLYPQRTTFPAGPKITFYSLGRVARMTDPGEFQLPRDSRDYVFHFTSWQQLKDLELRFGSPDGEFDVELRLFDVVLFRGRTSLEFKSLRIPEPSFYRYKNTHLYRLSIHLERKSGEIAFTKPYRLSLLPIA
jgi:hypothetical protein